jgi:uncharacterized protein YegJ (DUF2314 family)
MHYICAHMKYTLDDGEAVHREASSTFWIPDAIERQSLCIGQIVKLIFRIDLGHEVKVERMWVQVTARSASGYIGELDNDPYCTTEIRAGEIVLFEPRHVIDIYLVPNDI